jgi:hypothetical protein
MQIISPSNKRTELYEKFQLKIIHNSCLDRTLVSYQGNRQTPFSCWFKYREGFSERLVTYLLKTFKPEPGRLIDPFSGVGSSLFAARALGWQTTGIELLPVGIFATQARIIAQKIDVESLNLEITKLKQINFQDYYDQLFTFNHLAITRGAFSSINEEQLIGYISYCNVYFNHIFSVRDRTFGVKLIKSSILRFIVSQMASNGKSLVS